MKQTSTKYKKNIKEVKEIKDKLDGLGIMWCEERQELKTEIEELVKTTKVRSGRAQRG